MRKLLLNLHLYLALILGLFIITIGVTGSIMAFEQELDALLNPRLFRVQPQGSPMSITDLRKAASEVYPGQRISNFRLPQTSNESASFAIRGRKTAFIDPYTGKILGERDPDTPLNRIHQVHLRLLMGSIGSDIVVIATCVLLFLVVSGIYLWWPYKRFKIKWGASARRIHFDIHSVSGIYSAAFLLLLGITGVLLHFNDEVEQFILRKSGATKIVKDAPSVVRTGVKPITPDEAILMAVRNMPGTTALSITMPSKPKGSYLVALRYPEDLTPGGRSWVNIDQYSGQVVNAQNSRTAPAGTRARIFIRATHTGDVFGFTTKLLFSLTSLMLVVQAITGYYMWWKRMRVRQRHGPLQQPADSIA